MAKHKIAKGNAGRHGRASTSCRKMRAGKKATRRKTRKRPGHHEVQPRVWRRAARLAEDALTALDAGNFDEVRQCLEAVRAVAQCADER